MLITEVMSDVMEQAKEGNHYFVPKVRKMTVILRVAAET